ncbi:MAG TPA: hypothetical protein VL326_34175 [Kofleriaceae bacterium]|jgi:hypothetical protein|nr:hypothetical protein [Kofleriaceae bacterium]
MKTVISLGLVLAASTTAFAQPVTSPATCAVRVVRAPDDVRQVVEAWVKAEPKCSLAVEVRIIPTDGGLYLFALDERGRIRERMVPDAQSAGVLVASWVADDTMYTPPPKAPPTQNETVDPFAVRGSGPNSDLTTPGMTLSSEPVDGMSKVPANKTVSKWVGLGLVMTSDSNDGGIRLDADVWTRGKYSIGAALSSTSGHMDVISSQGAGTMMARDIKLMVTGSHTWQSNGRWFARGGAGLGLVHTQVFINIDEPSFNSSYGFYEAAGWTGVAEASLIGGAELGKNWSANFGPVVTLYAQNLHANDASGYMYETVNFERRDLQLMFYGGLKYRL